MSWIPVEERLPDRGYWLVTCEGFTNSREAYYDKGLWWRDENKDVELLRSIIAWQPLPAPYVKPRRFVVVGPGNLHCGPFMVRDTSEDTDVSFNIPTREAAEKIADIYEEAYRGE